MGHVALAGVAVGVLTGQQPVLTALVAAVAAAVAIELIRASGRTSGDAALAVMFYGGIALGVVLIARSSAGTPANLTGYLFGAILTTSTGDIVVFAVLAAVVLVTTLLLRPRFFAVANDEEYARAVGIPVLGYNLVLAVLTAVTVVVSMRVVGLLLISALMILPNATSQLFARSFRSAMWWAVVIGVSCSVGGVLVSYWRRPRRAARSCCSRSRRSSWPARHPPWRPGHGAPRTSGRSGTTTSTGRGAVTRLGARRPRRLPARRTPPRRARGALRRARRARRRWSDDDREHLQPSADRPASGRPSRGPSPGPRSSARPRRSTPPSPGPAPASGWPPSTATSRRWRATVRWTSSARRRGSRLPVLLDGAPPPPRRAAPAGSRSR